ncbi:hypothetical protein V1478_001723 [Vespula squamosa]|uniref:Uncharacterized protein n=1 Tax=Vespula squamosa TaxID=30214 RepID=A0ABD2BXX4_VESSQ
MIMNIDVYRRISNSDWIDTNTIDEIQSIQYQSNQWENCLHRINNRLIPHKGINTHLTPLLKYQTDINIFDIYNLDTIQYDVIICRLISIVLIWYRSNH